MGAKGNPDRHGNAAFALMTLNSVENPFEQLAADPGLFPTHLLVPYSQVGFCRMDAECYRGSPFLDHRMVSLEANGLRIGFTDVNRATELLHPQPAQFIFHNAFTCSTLLTRYLDAFEELLILREPNILYELATLHRFAGTPMLRPLQGVRWEELYRFTMMLLGRRFDHNRAVIIKPTDGCNNLMKELTVFHNENRTVFIYSPLERFLASVLRHPPRHEWARIRIRELLMDVQKKTGRVPVNPEQLEVWQAATLIWLLHTDGYIEAVQTDDADRYRSLEADRFLEDPAAALLAMSAHFGLRFTQEAIAVAVANAETDSNAKAAHETYDRKRRDEDFVNARKEFGQVIDRAHEWVRAFSADRDIRAPLPQPLCNR